MMTLSMSQMIKDPQQCNKWIQAYQEESKLGTALNELQNGRLCGHMQINFLGFLAVKMGDKQKLAVPQSLRQEVHRECHDILVVRYLGMCKTMDLVDNQFHWWGMHSDVTSSVQSCLVCEEVKSDN